MAESRESYELVLSLASYSVNKVKITSNLGPDWRELIKRRLSAELAHVLSDKTLIDLSYFLYLARWCPSHDAAGYLQWLKGLRESVLCETYARIRPGFARPLESELTWILHQATHMLELWHHEYFETIDASVLATLQNDASDKNQLLLTMAPEEVIAYATGGCILDNEALSRSVVLIPHYHCAPTNIITGDDKETLIFYPANANGAASWRRDASLRLPLLSRALDGRTRAEILNFLKTGPRSLVEISQHTGLIPARVRSHLTVLKEAGLLCFRINEREATLYAIAEQAVDSWRKTFHEFFGAGDSDKARES